MRQRVVIALALCTEPDVIIADEPTTALDVSVQAQILDLIKELAQERQVGVILITHDMGVIADTTDKVTVMYAGKVVETGPTAQVMGQPSHEYTKSLIAAVPRPTLKLHRFPQISYGGRETRFAIEDMARHWPKVDNDTTKPVFEIRNLTKKFLQRRGLLPWDRTYFTAVDERQFRYPRGRGVRRCGGIRLGQIHRRADDCGALPRRWRHDHVRGAGGQRSDQQGRSGCVSQEHPDDLSGSLFVAQPAYAGGRHRGRTDPPSPADGRCRYQAPRR